MAQPGRWGILVGAARSAEAWLPVGVLYALVWPAAAARTAWELGYRLRGTFARLPASFRTSTASTPARLLARVPLNAIKVTVLWPDRFHSPRWRARIRTEGIERFEQARAGGRPVLLATVHYGPTTAALPLLRRDGIRVAALTARDAEARPSLRKALHELGDRANGLEGVPSVFGVRALESALEFLRAGHTLLVLVDGPRGRQVTSRLEDHELQISSGVFQLAAMCGGVVVPCLLTAEPGLRATMHFADPVPDDLVTNYRQHPAACAHLHRALAPWLRARPEQAYSVLTDVLRPIRPERV